MQYPSTSADKETVDLLQQFLTDIQPGGAQSSPCSANSVLQPDTDTLHMDEIFIAHISLSVSVSLSGGVANH